MEFKYEPWEVAELIDIDTKQWKREEVFNNFNEFNMFCMKGPIIEKIKYCKSIYFCLLCLRARKYQNLSNLPKVSLKKERVS